MQKILIVVACFLSLQSYAAATWAYRVSFTNKAGGLSIADANQYLTPASLARRAKFNIPIDYTDIPVVKTYIDSVMQTANAWRLHNRSNWFNQIVILTDDTSGINDVRNLPFVSKVKMVAFYPGGWNFKGPDNNPLSNSKINTIIPGKKERGADAYYGASYKQLHYMNAEYLHDIGFKGENMNIAVIDMGFYKMDSLTALVPMNALGHLKDTWNFVRDTVNVYKVSTINITHGTDALTTMASNWPGQYVGSAPFANYYCYMSEDILFESPIEEDNWVSAAERADSMGVQIINTSLGYSVFDADFAADNYTYANMDGKTTLISRGQNMAFSKGIFCVAANGNSGLSATWPKLAAPADADSVYSVGIIDSSGKYNAAAGSSFGPSADGQVKPDGLSVGAKVALVGGNNMVGYTGGSSFAAPTLCGAIACLMQALPNLLPSEIKKLVHQSSSRYTTPSDSMGYGIPNFKLAFQAGSVLAIKELTMGNQNDYILFPNPAVDAISIQSTNTSPMFVTAIDAFGKIVINNKKVIGTSLIPTNQLPVGAYSMQINQDKSLVIKHFIKK
jgi:serine protease AprX